MHRELEVMDVLNEFYDVVSDPFRYGQKIKTEGNKKVIGFFCSYTPEEIILAAGAHPMRMFGTKGDITMADAHLQSYCCSLVRGALEDALTGRLAFLDGTVFPHTCDSIQRLSDVWRLNTDFSFFWDVVLPVKLDTASARDYLVEVLKRFTRDLEKGLRVDITTGKLRHAIKTYNIIRESLGTLYTMRAQNPHNVSGSDIHAIVKASMLMDRDYLARILPGTIEALKTRDREASPRRKKRIVLAGSICDHPDVYRVLDDAGGVVVGDDLCTGARYFDGKIDMHDDLIVALARRYMARPICPAKHMSLTARGENLVRIVRESKADGVIFLLLKFCDPHSFDYPYMKAYLDREGIPSMLLEIEDQLPSEGQLLTRFETFMHMI